MSAPHGGARCHICTAHGDRLCLHSLVHSGGLIYACLAVAFRARFQGRRPQVVTGQGSWAVVGWGTLPAGYRRRRGGGGPVRHGTHPCCPRRWLQTGPGRPCPVLTCPVLTCPDLSSPDLSCPDLSCPVLSSVTRPCTVSCWRGPPVRGRRFFFVLRITLHRNFTSHNSPHGAAHTTTHHTEQPIQQPTTRISPYNSPPHGAAHTTVEHTDQPTRQLSTRSSRPSSGAYCLQPPRQRWPDRCRSSHGIRRVRGTAGACVARQAPAVAPRAPVHVRRRPCTARVHGSGYRRLEARPTVTASTLSGAETTA